MAKNNKEEREYYIISECYSIIHGPYTLEEVKKYKFDENDVDVKDYLIVKITHKITVKEETIIKVKIEEIK